MIGALRGKGNNVIHFIIGKDGLWAVEDQQPVAFSDAVPWLVNLAPDAVFIALHGGFGEDGHIQGLLDMLRLPYTGSGNAACALAMDKVRSKAVVQVQGVRVARHVTFDAESWRKDPAGATKLSREIAGMPCVIKAPCQGSSCGLAICFSDDTFVSLVDQVMPFDGHVMIEEYLKGVEVTCSVLDADPEGRIIALPVTEIRPKTSAYFDYEAKYTPGASEEITPAPLPEEIARKVGEMAILVHQTIGCSGWSRSDFIIDARGPVWLEVNTVPGLTGTSLFPQAAAAAGISYEDLMDLFVQEAIRRGPRY